ncbi:unnamed protein product [Parnassius mnemosyne]|uniref:C-type lectin domain-containing protein n=1 Tax=Parnassius mnemosyne TaxID=213953 RepID=A0AAV1KL41_9NEOP
MFHQLFIYFLGITVVSASHNVNFFRRDYTFLEEYNAFYKLHWADDAGTWDEAFLACDDEGASLFYPEDVDEWQIARNLTDSPDVEGIFVGVHDELGRGDLLSFDGHFLLEFSELHVNNQDDSEPKCVVMSVNTGRYSIGYIYSKATKKCYKVHKRQTTWEDAMHTCYMEGGILSTDIHISELNDLLNMITKDQRYFMGFRKIMPFSDFYSVRGEKIDIFPRNEEYCGVVTVVRGNGYNSYDRIAKYSTHDCNSTLPFICELDVKF